MVDNLVGGFNPLKNMRSSLGMIFHSQLNGKIIQMFQTTNQNRYLDPPSTWNMGSVIYLSYPHDCWGRPWNYEYLKGLHHEPLLFLTLLRQLEVAATAARPIEKVSARRERMGLVGRGQGMDRPQYSQSVLNKQHEWINCMSVLEFAKIHKKYEHTGFEPG